MDTSLKATKVNNKFINEYLIMFLVWRDTKSCSSPATNIITPTVNYNSKILFPRSIYKFYSSSFLLHPKGSSHKNVTSSAI